MKAGSPSGASEHDEFLRAALRHAPDHALTPPSGVSQAILAAARRVHLSPRPASEPATPQRAPVLRHVPWHERLQWLLTPRWAGSLAAGLVGALVLGLWFEQDLPGPTASSGRDAAIAPSERTQPAAPPPAAPAPAPATTTSLPAPPAPDSATRGAGTPEPTRQGAAAPRPRAEAAPKRSDKAQDSAEAAADTQAKAEAESTLRREVPAARAATNEARMQAAPTPAAVPSTAPGASAAASPALTLWRRSTAESTARSAIWTWQPGDAPSPRSFDADAQAWLLRLVQSARGRWVDVAVASNGEAATEVRWWRDDQPHARLRIEAEGLRWIEPSGRIRYAPMEPAALARLRGF